MSSTNPALLAILTTSPFLKWFSEIINKPWTISLTKLCVPKPTAIAITEKVATKDVIGTPIIWSIVKTAIVTMKTLRMLLSTIANVSILLLFSSLSITSSWLLLEKYIFTNSGTILAATLNPRYPIIITRKIGKAFEKSNL